MTAVVPRSSSQRLRGFVALTKPRIIELLLVTTVPTMIVAEQGMPPIWLIVATLVGGTLAAGGAHAINMVVDRDIDALMERTKGRPLVTGLISPQEALAFAFALEAVAFVWLWGFVNLLSAVLGLAACLFYVFVYTLWLKRSSSQNIVIGGAAGAVPVLIGWSSVTDSLDWAPVVLFAVIFFWTPPHFWALAIRYRDDYSAAEVPMLPSVAPYRATANQIIAYTIITWAATLVFAPVAEMGLLYTASAALLGAAFLALGVQLRRAEHEPAERRSALALGLFKYSITYVTLLFGAMAADQLLRSGL